MCRCCAVDRFCSLDWFRCVGLGGWVSFVLCARLVVHRKTGLVRAKKKISTKDRPGTSLVGLCVCVHHCVCFLSTEMLTVSSNYVQFAFCFLVSALLVLDPGFSFLRCRYLDFGFWFVH